MARPSPVVAGTADRRQRVALVEAGLPATAVAEPAREARGLLPRRAVAGTQAASALLRPTLTLDCLLVGIGASAGTYYPEIARAWAPKAWCRKHAGVTKRDRRRGQRRAADRDDHDHGAGGRPLPRPRPRRHPHLRQPGGRGAHAEAEAAAGPKPWPARPAARTWP